MTSLLVTVATITTGVESMTAQQNPAGRILRDIRHGGEVLADSAKNARELAEVVPNVSLASDAVPGVDIQADEATSRSAISSTPWWTIPRRTCRPTIRPPSSPL